MSPTITIPAPVAVVGERVLVLNYRCRPARWESGVVIEVEYWSRWSRDAWSWKYQVLLDRRSTPPRGGSNPITLYLTNDGIQVCAEQSEGDHA
jgi:hypothetical protein